MMRCAELGLLPEMVFMDGYAAEQIAQLEQADAFTHDTDAYCGVNTLRLG